MYKRNFELAETNKTLSLLQKINDLFLLSDGSVEMLAQNICRTIIETTAHIYIGIYKFHGEDRLEHFGSILASSAAEKVLSSVRLPDEWHAHEVHTALLQLDDPEIGQLYVHRLRTRTKTHMALVVGYPSGQSPVPSERDDVLFARLADTVGVVVESKILSDENAHVLLQLKRSNDKLKALDEAKDEFISMASHQLRTPLTSIKGYLSMVLEGDVGEVPDQQKEMLNTAFTSAQRMVYLISDLLNVSRLQTGKFVIEPTESYLPDVVEEELTQLKEAIAAKNICLTYKKPKHFPKVIVDETKLRQVIMNFTDNALYYTPMGGKVQVALKETQRSIEFTVEDNGIGVPKGEQHKLFAKFYRAGNARKARPDGTGLGLFMAKKVIVASGGAIIFKTKEGKGSTFGFVFPKSKVAIKNNP
jgi:signal transduction histidine kinase